MKLTPEQFKEHSQKVKEGQARSKKRIGRPSRLDKNEILKLHQTKSVSEIAGRFGVSRQAIYNIINS